MIKNLFLKFAFTVAVSTSCVQGETSPLRPITNTGWMFKIGDSFTCFSDIISTLGYNLPEIADRNEKMGEVTTYKNVGFGFSILNASTIKFSKSYPMSRWKIFEAIAELDSVGNIDYVHEWATGKIRLAKNDTYFLRVVGWNTGSTDIMHATCEKL